MSTIDTPATGTLQSRTAGARDAARRYADTARGQLQSTQQRAIETARERPAATALAAFGLGLAAGYLLAACTTNTRARWRESADQAARRVGERLRNRAVEPEPSWS